MTDFEAPLFLPTTIKIRMNGLPSAPQPDRPHAPSESSPHVDQFHPLEINPHTGEPFLRLRKHKNIIITPVRDEDAKALVPIMNDPLVYEGLLRHPFPYHLKDGEEYVKTIKLRGEASWRALLEAQASSTQESSTLMESPAKQVLIDGCPVSALREIQPDGSDVYIGRIEIRRSVHGEIMETDTVDFERAQEKMDRNNAKPLGDPDIIWSIGDFLSSKYHNRGIMTDAIDTVIHDWAVPRMGTQKILTGAFTGNTGSVKVFQKNGFRLVRVIDKFKEARGVMRGMNVLEWNLNWELDSDRK